MNPKRYPNAGQAWLDRHNLYQTGAEIRRKYSCDLYGRMDHRGRVRDGEGQHIGRIRGVLRRTRDSGPTPSD
jgi:hypothetical protein